jgi:hypothetical protein
MKKKYGNKEYIDFKELIKAPIKLKKILTSLGTNEHKMV